jgi:SP family myo-inositol transporter-like MFS transporter 13
MYGRRKVIIAASALFSIGAVICGAAPNRYVLLIGRVLLGLAIGLYLSEKFHY